MQEHKNAIYCENFHSIVEVDGRRYCNLDEKRAKYCGIAYSIYNFIFLLYVPTFSQATKALRESRGIALLCFQTSALEGGEPRPLSSSSS
jgi:hypothetical protein